MSYVIGVDGGTESIRAFVFDLSGRPIASVATPYKTDFPHPSWAEQDPAAWWAAMGQSVQGAVAKAGVSPGDIVAMSVDTTCCSVVALDAAGTPLRPCMIWMDVRSAKEADEVAATKDPNLRVNGGGSGPVSAEWMIPKSLWMKRHQPDIFARATRIGEYQDYINLRLTASGWARSAMPRSAGITRRSTAACRARCWRRSASPSLRRSGRSACWRPERRSAP